MLKFFTARTQITKPLIGNTMTKSGTFILLASCFILTACQSHQPKTEAPIVEEADPDIVVMPGVGENSGSSSLLGVKPMTLDELTNCAKKISSIREHTVQLKVEDLRLARRKKELEQVNQALEIERSTVDIKNIKKVNDFNKRLKQSMTNIGQFDAEINKYNSDQSEQMIRTNEFNTSCASRSFRQSDIARLTQELRDAIETSSEVSDIPLTEDASELGNPSKSKIHIKSH